MLNITWREAEKLLPIIEAMAEGKTIEYSPSRHSEDETPEDDWDTCLGITLEWVISAPQAYRVKP